MAHTATKPSYDDFLLVLEMYRQKAKHESFDHDSKKCTSCSYALDRMRLYAIEVAGSPRVSEPKQDILNDHIEAFEKELSTFDYPCNCCLGQRELTCIKLRCDVCHVQRPKCELNIKYMYFQVEPEPDVTVCKAGFGCFILEDQATEDAWWTNTPSE